MPDGEPRKLGVVPFAPGIAVTGDLSVMDQIVATLGRSHSWPAGMYLQRDFGLQFF